MIYTKFIVGQNEYQLRLNARNCVELEQKLGCNPLNIFTELKGNQIPPLSALLTILHYSMKDLNHGISADDVYDIYDAYCENGGTMTTLIELLLDVFKDSGFIPDDNKPTQTHKKSKN